MNRRVAIIVAGLVVAAIPLLACGEGGISAEKRSERACIHLLQIDHDVESIGVNEHSMTKSRHEFSGSSSRWTGMVYTPDGEDYLGKFDYIFHEQVWYARNTDPEAPHTWKPWEVVETGLSIPVQGSPYSCFEPDTDALDAGDEDRERHFVVEEETSHGTSSREEFWVDAYGRPVRRLVTVREAPLEDFSPDSDTTGGTGRILVQVDDTFSGYGQPNVIKAPITPPTPQPDEDED